MSMSIATGRPHEIHLQPQHHGHPHELCLHPLRLPSGASVADVAGAGGAAVSRQQAGGSADDVVGGMPCPPACITCSSSNGCCGELHLSPPRMCAGHEVPARCTTEDACLCTCSAAASLRTRGAPGVGIQCANCGGSGHVYRVCNHPITSFGIICFHRGPDGAPLYLMVQRKDSLAYTEIIRGKYSLQNRGYLLKLIANMTPEERQRLLTTAFDDLWADFWQTSHNCAYMKEYHQSRDRFQSLTDGYFLRSASDPGQLVFFDIESATSSVPALHPETEWGFPKGRRNIDESDMRCACREFMEETGVDLADVQVLPSARQFEEVFTGSNRVRYRHVYYAAELQPASAERNGATVSGGEMPAPAQSREIRRTGWFDAEGVLAHIREENVERREMFKRVHAWVTAR